MNTMEALSKIQYRHQPLIHLPNHNCSSFPSKPISSLSFKTRPVTLSIKSSISNQNLKPSETLFSFLKPTLIATVTATALFLTNVKVRPSFASPPPPPPPTISTTQNDAVLNDKSENEYEKEKAIEHHLLSHPNDVEALRNLMEIQIKTQRANEAITTIEKLIQLEPNDPEWPLLKSHMHCYGGDVEMARKGFNEILEKDPFRVEAYHGLVVASSYEESPGELKEIENKILEGMVMCKRENKRDDLRDFKLLLAQIKVIEGEYEEALRIYQELVREEPRDFRPYLCQGIIYTLLKKKDEAEKNFEKYRRLVPKGHPYARYFDDNMFATKLFAQKAENERAGSRS